MTSTLLLTSLLPDVLHAIVRLSCSDMHSKDATAASAAQDTATALRLTCRTLRAAVDATVADLTCLDIRASSSVDIAQAAALFPGLQHALGGPPISDSQMWRHHGTITYAYRHPTTCRPSKDTYAGSGRRNHDQGQASADAVSD